MKQEQTLMEFSVAVQLGWICRSYIKNGEAAAREWLRTEGRRNIEELNQVLDQVATSWKERI